MNKLTARRIFIFSTIFLSFFAGAFAYSVSTEGNTFHPDYVSMNFDFLSEPVESSSIESGTITYADFSKPLLTSKYELDITFDNGDVVSYQVDGYDRRDFRSLDGFDFSRKEQSIPIEFIRDDKTFIIFSNN